MSAREIEEWERDGRDLATVDPARFRKYARAVRAVVSIHAADDPAAVLDAIKRDVR